MTNLRILLVEADESRAGQLVSRLWSAENLTIPVANPDEALEALTIQKFDVVLLGSGQSAEQIEQFVTKLRNDESDNPDRSRVAVLAYSSACAHLPIIDGFLHEDFGLIDLEAVVSECAKRSADFAAQFGTPRTNLPVFLAEAFREQCADDTDLMAELVDLFTKEREKEIPEMKEALASSDFEQLSRLAHTIKGSLGSLHAPAAQRRAKKLEAAAKEQNLAACQSALDVLEHEIKRLADQLESFLQACLGR